ADIPTRSVFCPLSPRSRLILNQCYSETSPKILFQQYRREADIRPAIYSKQVRNSLFLEKNSLIRVWKFPVPLRREFGCKLLDLRVDQTRKSEWVDSFSEIPCYFPC